jgi:hypothetical protein
MFLSILKWGVISLTIIYLIHHFYIFFLNTLTVPKIKDLVNKPNEQYDEMFKTLQGNSTKNDILSKHKDETINDDKMTEELSSFLNELKKNPESNTRINDISTHMNNTNESNNILGANEVDSYSAF